MTVYSNEEAINILVTHFSEEKKPCLFGDNGDRSLVKRDFCHDCPFWNTGCSDTKKTTYLAKEMLANKTQTVKEL